MTTPLAIAAVVPSESPPRWAQSAVAQIARLEHVALGAIVVKGDEQFAPSSRLSRAIMALYGAADARAYPLDMPALDPVPLGTELRRLLREPHAVHDAGWVIDLRDGVNDRLDTLHAMNGLIRVRIELVARGDRSLLDAIRRRSPLASVVELLDGDGRRVLARTVGACDPLSRRRTLDTAYRRAEVLLVRAVRELRP